MLAPTISRFISFAKPCQITAGDFSVCGLYGCGKDAEAQVLRKAGGHVQELQLSAAIMSAAAWAMHFHCRTCNCTARKLYRLQFTVAMQS